MPGDDRGAQQLDAESTGPWACQRFRLGAGGARGAGPRRSPERTRDRLPPELRGSTTPELVPGGPAPSLRSGPPSVPQR